MAFALATWCAGLLARRGFPLPDAKSRIGWVDGLRGYLALAVMVHHFVIRLQITRLGGAWVEPQVNLLNQLGGGAVALFFMTTGLVFYPKVLRGFAAVSWPAVYITRAFRLLPLILVSVAAVMLVVALRTGASPRWRDLPALAQWISASGEPPLLGYPESGRLNAYVLWSLWYEWIFYLVLLPACALAMDAVRGRMPTWVVPAGLLAVTLGARAARIPYAVPLPLFAVGMLAYEVQQVERLRVALSRRWTGAAALAGLAAVAVATPSASGTIGLPANLLLCGFFFACVACGNDILGVLRRGGALVLGECSYGLYLLHGLLLDLLFVEGARLIAPLPTWALPILMLPLAAVLLLLTATTFRRIEKPALAAGYRLAAQWTGRPPPQRDGPDMQTAP